MSIKAQHITKNYGSQKALDDVSFEIPSGQIAGFIGPNGAGKSTMMKIITSYLPPTSGTASVAGRDVIEESLEVRRHIGYLPEDNPLYVEMYVREYLEFVKGIYAGQHKKSSDGEETIQKIGKKRISEVVELTGLGREQHKRIGELSKGYRQRVGLAQAILHDPEVLILDEPTSGLDPNQIIEIRNLIVDLGKEKTVMLSTHLMQEVEAICDRVIIINRGKIVADGLPGEISSGLKPEVETIVIEFDREADMQKIEALEGVLNIRALNKNQILVETVSDTDLRPILFQFAVSNGLTVLSMQKKEKSLEEAFQELTGRGEEE